MTGDFKHFIFQPGLWLGHGKIDLSMAKESLKYSTRWKIEKEKKSQIVATQEIEVTGLSDLIKNKFIFYHIKPNRFKIRLESQNLGEVVGEGIIKNDLVAWEFKQQDSGFEGYELYHLQEDQSYKVVAEYATTDSFRSKIQGHIWQKVS